MNESIIRDIIGAVVGISLAILNAITIYHVLRAKQDIKEVVRATNGMKDQLMAKTEEEALLRGKAAGVVQERVRTEGRADKLVETAADKAAEKAAAKVVEKVVEQFKSPSGPADSGAHKLGMKEHQEDCENYKPKGSNKP